MNTSKFLNLSESDLDRYIYRIISVDRLIELFNKNQNGLVTPDQWEDPFESLILKSNFVLADGTPAKFSNPEKMSAAQCWSLHRASDAMWRIYSKDKQSVRIRTTIRKLFNSLYDSVDASEKHKCFIGKVDYLRQDQIINFGNTVFRGDGPLSVMLAKSLLIKRRAFQHENEIRLIFMPTNFDSDLFFYDINPHELIEQIMTDPRLDKSESNLLKQKIIEKTAFSGPIKRSLLYAPPEGFVFKMG